LNPAAALFRHTFGVAPSAIASAPGRINLIGEHTDYNGGPVLPFAISRRTTVAVGPGRTWDFASTEGSRAPGLEVGAPMTGHWSDYVRGVIRELGRAGASLPGGRVAVASDIPIGAGLSSSAALSVAAAVALSRLSGATLAGPELAEVAYRAEHDQVGVRCGRMDQTIAALGREGEALLLETATGELERVPMPGAVHVVETGVRHRQAGQLNDRRRECEEALAVLQKRWPGLASLAAIRPAQLPEVESLLQEVHRRRVRHVVTETARTRTAATALAAGELWRVGAVLVEGQASLSRDYESSIPEADLLAGSAVRHGAWGARLTGAGWGGAVIVLAPDGEASRIMAGVSADFEAAFGRVPVTWETRASAGVRGDV
jgi:galactokinase